MAVGPLAQIHVSVTDLDRSIGFYGDMLGIPLLWMAFCQDPDGHHVALMQERA